MRQTAALSAFVALATSAAAAALSSAASARQRALETAWASALDDDSKRPLERVVFLLGKMKTDIEEEADKESKMYEKSSCWCKKNTEETTQAISEANAKEQQLLTTIETTSALDGKYDVDLKHMRDEIETMEVSLYDTRRYREVAHDENVLQIKDLKSSIESMKGAIKILELKAGVNLLQRDASVHSGMEVVLRNIGMKHELLLADHGGLPSKRSSFPELPVPPKTFLQKRASSQKISFLERSSSQTNPLTEESAFTKLQAALSGNGGQDSEALPLKYAESLVAQAAEAAEARSQQSSASFLQADAVNGAKEVIAILKSMRFDFEEELLTLSDKERTDQEEFERLEKAKMEELTAAKSKHEDTKEDYISNQKTMFTAKKDLRDLKRRRAKDQSILAEVKETCFRLEKEWERRSKVRGDELSAVTKTIGVLTSDENRARMREARDREAQSFLQMTRMRRRQRNIAQVEGRPGSTFESDPFNPIYAALEKMVGDLEEEQTEERKKRQYCLSKFKENELETQRKQGKHETQEAHIDRMAVLKGRTEKELEEVKHLHNETKQNMVLAGQTREQENAEFQTTMADQRAVQTILKKALLQLKEFYQKPDAHKVAMLLQTSQEQPEPPEEFEAQKEHAGGRAAMELLQHMIDDAAELEREAADAEADAQQSYEKFMADSRQQIKDQIKTMRDKWRAIRKSTVDAVEDHKDLAKTKADINALIEEEHDLRKQCNNLLKTFDRSQSDREQEINSVKAAHAMLRGAH
eukprot:TRINITY_DN87849_c0_g1_i1.p1 TRINITY_DN87849_c0_g1~~TRINITY_DN87849_c0_g1_i1.p1  ORF type:complete len:757 (+),score=231.06 TRINITY_DN87849_c0_g1_i1:101-2371(+)